MRNSDMDQGIVARAEFENPFAGAELGFALEDVDTLLVRVDVGGYPAASVQRAHRESRVDVASTDHGVDVWYVAGEHHRGDRVDDGRGAGRLPIDDAGSGLLAGG